MKYFNFTTLLNRAHVAFLFMNSSTYFSMLLHSVIYVPLVCSSHCLYGLSPLKGHAKTSEIQKYHWCFIYTCIYYDNVSL